MLIEFHPYRFGSGRCALRKVYGRFLALGCVLVLALGCGGGGGSDTSTGTDTNIPSDAPVDKGPVDSICTPDCTDKTCGDDGCGGSCGTCAPGEICYPGIGKCEGDGDIGPQKDVLESDYGPLVCDNGQCGWTVFKAVVKDYLAKFEIQGAEVVAIDNDTGELLDYSAISDLQGNIEMKVPAGIKLGFRVTANLFKDTYQFNIDSDAQDEEIWAVSNNSYGMAVMLAGLDPEYGTSVVAGALYWMNLFGEEEPISCGHIVTNPAGEYRYFDEYTGLPAPLEAVPVTMADKAEGRFIAGNIPPGKVVITAFFGGDPTDADQFIGESTFFAYPDSICIANVYADSVNYPTVNPSPPTCNDTCVLSCFGKECGDDGCGGFCGDCGEGKTCENHMCVDDCTPDCSLKECGDDGCGGSCGVCGDGKACSVHVCMDCGEIATFVLLCGDETCEGAFLAGVKENVKTKVTALFDCVSALNCGSFIGPGGFKECAVDGCIEVISACYTGTGECSDIRKCRLACPTWVGDHSCALNCWAEGSQNAQIIWQEYADCIFGEEVSCSSVDIMPNGWPFNDCEKFAQGQYCPMQTQACLPPR